MKAKDFGQFLEAFAEMLAEAGSVGQARAWRELMPIFKAKPLADIKDICKLMAQIDSAKHAGGFDIQNVITLMRSLKRCLGDNAKKAFIDDLTRLANALGPFSRFPIADFTNAMVVSLTRPMTTQAYQVNEPPIDLIKSYLRDLEDALRDEVKFPELFKKLKNDRDMKAPQVKQLAKEFAAASEKTKESALDRILARHESLVGVGARAKATGGRTAA